MGTRSSSSAGGGGASGDSPGGFNNNLGSRGLQDDDDEENVDLAQVLAYLLRRGQVRLVQGGGPESLHLVQSLSDSDDDNDSAWEGCLGDRYNPPVDPTPDTAVLDQSQIKTQVLLATGRIGACKKKNITRQLLERERGGCGFSHGERCRVTSNFLPNHVSATDLYTQKAFCGVYSSDGATFMSACQDQNIRLYDCRHGSFKKFRTIKARDVGWSVLDVAFTPDGEHFLYSSWSDYSTFDLEIWQSVWKDLHVQNPILTFPQVWKSLKPPPRRNLHASLYSPSDRRFAVFSLTVSSDGREVLGGANDGCVYVYDREQNRRTLKISSHEDDVNAVSFADDSCHILYSGGDDALCKVWDRRTMREDDPKPVGLLAGHQDGITFIDSKGDARYLLSNSKDQSIKLWDIRKFSGPEGLEASRRAVTQQNWDYRWQQVPKKALRRKCLPGDTSLMTYRGHGVLHTLIRSRFSPAYNTGQQYVYSGCSTGRVVIYDLLTGEVVKKLTNHKACVRDVTWHPCDNRLVSSSWDGTVRVWEHRQTEFYEEDLSTAPEGSPASSSCSW